MRIHSTSELIDSTRVSTFQYGDFGLCFLVAILDGLNIQVIAFTDPRSLRHWDSGLAPILTAEIVGMVMGAMALVVALLFALPESLYFLTRQRSTLSLEKINTIVAKIT